MSLLASKEGREALLFACAWDHRYHTESEEHCVTCAAGIAANSPAKLTELLAEALRERGTIVYLGDPGDSLRFPCVMILVDGPGLWIERFSDQEAVEDRMHGLYLDMSRARAALLRILELPEGATTEEAIKALQCK